MTDAPQHIAAHHLFRHQLFLRPATSNDMMLYFHWANDPAVRAHSFTQEPIPLDTHQRWFERALTDPHTVLYVAELLSVERLATEEMPSQTLRQSVGQSVGQPMRQPIGQIRFHLADGVAEIGFSLDEAFRGKGLGTALLRAGTERLVQEHGQHAALHTVRGAVKVTNPASALAFERAGFVRSTDSTDTVIYYEWHISR